MGSSDTIRFSSETLESIIKQLQQTQSSFQTQKSRLSSICSSIDRQSGGDLRLSGSMTLHCGVTVGSGNVKSTLSDYSKAISACSSDIGDLSKTLSSVCSMFIDTEKRIMNRIDGLSAADASGFSGSFNVGNAVAGDTAQTESFGQQVKNKFLDFVDKWKTGAAIIKGKFDDLTSAFAADWEAKGLSYRIINGLGAVVNIVTGVATVACAIAGTGITAGLSTPVTAIIGAYGANSVISGLADLYNCTFGDVNNVGQVNIIKDGLTIIGGQVGEWFGNREMGEAVGEITYIAGGLTSAVVSLKNLAGQIKQAGSAGNTLKQSIDAAKKMFSGAADEASDAAKGLGYLLTKCDVRNLGPQFSLFKKSIPNISSIISDVKLVEKGVSGYKKLIDAGVEITNTLTGWEMLKQPIIFDSASQIGKILSVPGDAIKGISGIDFGDIQDGAKRIQDVFSLAFR